ncbi:sporulation protein YpjB [Gorillibacterium sp. sgz5001074]|uniref:sporulation protein YpjB n=1 Tax=Gorillibacterium sp. sgz5001074 TaxID=3446695 RepID=UPI003F677F05
MFVGGKKRRGVLLLFILVAIMAWGAGCGMLRNEAGDSLPAVDPARQQQLEELNRTADELYENATAGSFMGARDRLYRLGDQAAGLSFTGITGIEGVDALSDAIVEAKRVFNAARLDPSECVRMAAILKLAVDTLTHPNQPMWLQYYKVLTEDTKQFERAVRAGSRTEAAPALRHMKEHYGTIRPAVWISRKPEEAEKMDSLLTYFTKATETGSFRPEVLETEIGQWKESLDTLFRKNGDRTAYMPGIQPDRPVLWTFTVGSVIIAVLMFAAWRMFVSERDSVRRPRRVDG